MTKRRIALIVCLILLGILVYGIVNINRTLGTVTDEGDNIITERSDGISYEDSLEKKIR